LTGEGRDWELFSKVAGSYDATSETGKVPHEVTKYAQKYNVPVIIICGKKDIKDSNVPIFDLLSLYPMEVSMKNTRECLQGLISKTVPVWPVLGGLVGKE
jgi:glycerate kinase